MNERPSRASWEEAFQVEDIRPGMRLLALFPSSGPARGILPLGARSLVLGCALEGQTALPPGGAGNLEFVAAAGAGALRLESPSPAAQVALVLEAGAMEPLLSSESDLSELACWLSASAEPWLVRESKPLAADKRLVARQIFSCRLRGSLKRLFLEAKANELLALFLGSPAVPRGSGLSREDRRKLYMAEEILKTNLASPPSLKALSRSCGLNENKVKRGFREMFGESVGSLLRRERMRLALDLLTASDLPVGLVANSVGYSNHSHFIAAFRREFGDTPGRLRRIKP